MCRRQTLIGLPRIPPPWYQCDCPIYSLGKLNQVRKGKTVDTPPLSPGDLLHIDFAFWYVTSHRGFTAILMVVDAKTRMLWLFCKSIKKPPLHILRWLFSNLRREKRVLTHIHVDEDGALARTYAFCFFIRD
jgi:hypothetical protein